MPHKSRWSVDIPLISLPSLILGSPSDILPDTPAFIDTEKPDTLNFSWAEFALWSRRLAAGLIKAGLQPQDRVLIYSGNNIFFPVVFMGVIMAGGIITTANPTFVARELAYQLKDSGARFLLLAEASLETALQAAKSIKYSQENMFIFDDAPFYGRGQGVGAVGHWKNLIGDLELGEAFRWEEGNTEEFSRRTVAILYSSGTTGLPKGVEITHSSLVANCCQMDFLYNLDPRFTRSSDNVNNQHLLCALPMYHGLGLLFFTTVAPYRRLPVYIMKRYSLPAMLDSIQRFRITELTLVPPIVVAMAKSPEAKSGQYDLSSIRKIVSGAAPLSREICAELEKLWPKGQMNVKQGWGMTELPITSLNWDEREISTTQAVGEPVPNCEVKLMDDDGVSEVPNGQRGELWVLCLNAMKGYWGNPEATRETITADGWVKTGDIAFRDQDGKYCIVDRKKELIKVKGNQVAPAELEGVLLEHPDVQDAAVIGVKIDEDERPLAYVVRRPSSNITADAILTFMNERTSKIKHLHDVIFTTNIPKNPSGKILRRQLRQMAEVDSASVKRSLDSKRMAKL